MQIEKKTEKVEKVVTVEEETFVLKLSRQDAERLMALVDVPYWYGQPESLRKWLSSTFDAMGSAFGFFAYATEVGFRRADVEDDYDEDETGGDCWCGESH